MPAKPPRPPTESNKLPPLDAGACGAASVDVVASDVPPEEMALYAAELAKARRRVAVKNRQQLSPQRRRLQNAPAPVLPPSPLPLSGWGVFLGAYPNEQDAQRIIRALRLRIGRLGTGRTELRRRDGRFRGLIYGLDRSSASAACRAAGQYCVVLSPELLLNQRARWRR